MNRICAWAVLMLFAVGVQTSAAQNCDRACLKNTMTTYLNALVAQDPSKAPLAANVRFTEDAKELKVGDGFWKKATKLGDYRQDFIDVKEQVIASWVIVEESGRPAKLTARLKVANGRITEIETLVSPAGERVSGGATMVARPDMGIAPPAGQRNSRDELIRAADHYPRGLTIGGFDKVDAPFAKDAYRIENGMVMAGPGCGRGGPGGAGLGAPRARRRALQPALRPAVQRALQQARRQVIPRRCQGRCWWWRCGQRQSPSGCEHLPGHQDAADHPASGSHQERRGGR